MGFLKRVAKTPDESQDEGEDEFNAEENGLLMASSPPSDAQTPAGEVESTDPSPPAEAEPAQDPVVQVAQGGGDPLDMTAEPPSAESQAQQGASAEAPANEAATDDDALALFKASAKEGATGIPPVLKEDLEDIPAADLLAEARAIRAGLLGVDASGGEMGEAGTLPS